MSPNLPAPTFETRNFAFAFAVRCVCALRDNGALAPQAGEDVKRRWMREAVLGGTAQMRLFTVMAAEAGDEDADAVVRDVLVEMDSRSITPTAELAAYRMKVLTGFRPPPRPPGPRPKDRFVRDIAIVMVVAAVVDTFGIPATSRSARGASACGIVAEALREVHILVGTKAVENIWNRYGRRIPRGFDWPQIPRG